MPGLYDCDEISIVYAPEDWGVGKFSTESLQVEIVPEVQEEGEIPPSFLSALDNWKNGNLIDLDVAINQEPPPDV